eukprot:SM000088S23741  [mRNA]  locus=s88:480049:482060:+ [translate_table: standard]
MGSAINLDGGTGRVVVIATLTLLLLAIPFALTDLSQLLQPGLGSSSALGEIRGDVKLVLARLESGAQQLATNGQAALDGPQRCPTVQRETTRPFDPWRSMKWVARPAPCKVKGYDIEEIDANFNMRRSYALGHVPAVMTGFAVEDKTQLLPWLLASRDYDKYSKRAQRVYIDLGGNRFGTSVTWFLRWYPLDFTELHVFEIKKGLFRIPKHRHADVDDLAMDASSRVQGSPFPIPDWQLDRIKSYRYMVSHEDVPAQNKVNITRVMKEELKLTADDTVIVKMDIEGSEWPLLGQWMESPDMVDIVDELFVEVHFHHPSMTNFHWTSDHFTHTREEAVNLIQDLRDRGFFAHNWP